jgi:hypothetical protein
MAIDKTAFYIETIKPLMEKVRVLCEAEGINHVSCFQLTANVTDADVAAEIPCEMAVSISLDGSKGNVHQILTSFTEATEQQRQHTHTPHVH